MKIYKMHSRLVGRLVVLMGHGGSLLPVPFLYPDGERQICPRTAARPCAAPIPPRTALLQPRAQISSRCPLSVEDSSCHSVPLSLYRSYHRLALCYLPRSDHMGLPMPPPAGDHTLPTYGVEPGEHDPGDSCSKGSTVLPRMQRLAVVKLRRNCFRL